MKHIRIAYLKYSDQGCLYFVISRFYSHRLANRFNIYYYNSTTDDVNAINSKFLECIKMLSKIKNSSFVKILDKSYNVPSEYYNFIQNTIKTKCN